MHQEIVLCIKDSFLNEKMPIGRHIHFIEEKLSTGRHIRFIIGDRLIRITLIFLYLFVLSSKNVKRKILCILCIQSWMYRLKLDYFFKKTPPLLILYIMQNVAKCRRTFFKTMNGPNDLKPPQDTSNGKFPRF